MISNHEDLLYTGPHDMQLGWNRPLTIVSDEDIEYIGAIIPVTAAEFERMDYRLTMFTIS
jgi:hypothetical protein